MGSAYLQNLAVQNYGCLKNVTAELTPLHAFIGPNDSGKSTILRAARIVGDLLEQASQPSRLSMLQDAGLEPDRQPRIQADFGAIKADFQSSSGPKWGFSVAIGSQSFRTVGNGEPTGNTLFTQPESRVASQQLAAFNSVANGARLLRLDPDALRLESQLIPETEPVRFYDERGHRLAGIYDAILNRGDQSFRQILEKVTQLFPTIKAIRLRNVNQTTKALEVELNDGTRVPAKFASEGLLYYLAFASLQYLAPCSMLLVEDPENGLHPIRIAEIMSVLREISKTTQVLIATHSPLIVNELSPNEVSVTTRTQQEGTTIRRLSSSQDIEERMKVYAPGELWLSYANGVNEDALFSRPSKS